MSQVRGQDPAMFSGADQRLAVFASASITASSRSADARRAGLTDRQIDHRVATAWIHLYDGVYRMPGAPPTWQVGASRRDMDGELSCRRLASLGSGALRVARRPRRRGRADLQALAAHKAGRGSSSTKAVGSMTETYNASTALQPCDPSATCSNSPAFDRNPRFVESVVQAARRRRLITYESTVEMFDRHARRGLKGVQALARRCSSGGTRTAGRPRARWRRCCCNYWSTPGMPDARRAVRDRRPARAASSPRSTPPIRMRASRSSTTASRSTRTSSNSPA